MDLFDILDKPEPKKEKPKEPVKAPPQAEIELPVEQEIKPQTVVLPPKKPEQKKEPQPEITRKKGPPFEYEYEKNGFIYDFQNEQPVFEYEKRVVRYEIREEAKKKIEEKKTFQKGEKSQASIFMDAYKAELLQNKSKERNEEINEILSLIRKEAAQSRSEIAKSVKEKIANQAIDNYPQVDERRYVKKIAAAREKSPKIGKLEEVLRELTLKKFLEALKRELGFLLEKKQSPKPPQTPMPALKKYCLEAMEVRKREQLHPQKELIFNDMHHPNHSAKSQIEALNKPTAFTKSKLKYPVAQLIVSLPEGVKIEKSQAVWMCQRHMLRMGIDPTQHTYFIYKHSNTKNEHYHLVYNRVRLDGGVHHLPGANQVAHLETALQDFTFGIKQKINPLTARDKLSRIVQSRIASVKLHFILGRFSNIPMTSILGLFCTIDTRIASSCCEKPPTVSRALPRAAQPNSSRL